MSIFSRGQAFIIDWMDRSNTRGRVVRVIKVDEDASDLTKPALTLGAVGVATDLVGNVTLNGGAIAGTPTQTVVGRTNRSAGTKLGHIMGTNNVAGDVARTRARNGHNMVGVAANDAADNAAVNIIQAGFAQVLLLPGEVPTVGMTVWLADSNAHEGCGTIVPPTGISNARSAVQVGVVTSDDGEVTLGAGHRAGVYLSLSPIQQILPLQVCRFTGLNGAGDITVDGDLPVQAGSIFLGAINLTDFSFTRQGDAQFAQVIAADDTLTQTDITDLSAKNYVGFFYCNPKQVRTDGVGWIA